eukprot:CAMPEP_0116117222 /NCGR_PEP_ID=MMETSP0329-20121206/1454_1 /TAXON_ID=697910 /ORGANISM="Pseudo-nitzschia arenysensis, Strain B593" /LENGTH=545 /DNA_ID=CAMNT_0003610765 /DNA_START=26 /DNA_END=1663 /DNA_ORIENTATION=+
MSEYTPFSQIMNGDENTFDEVWEDNMSSSEAETKEDSPPSLIPLETTPVSEPAPVVDLAEKKPKHEEVTISTIEAEDQTIVSAISKTSLRSRAACFEMPTILCETSSINGDLSEITDTRTEKRRKEKAKSGFCVNITILDSCTSEDPLKIPECISNVVPSYNAVPSCETMCVSAKCAMQPSIADAYSPSLFDDEDDITAKPKEEKIPTDSKQANTSQPATTPIQPKEEEKAKTSSDTVATPQVEPKSTPFNVCFADTEHISTSITEMLASASNHFTSSSLSVDGDCSVLFVAATGESQKQIVSVPTEMSALTLDSPPATREEVRRDDRNLLDLLSQVLPEDDRTLTTIGENITEGLGLDLPATPLPERPEVQVAFEGTPAPETPKPEEPKQATPVTPNTQDSGSTNMGEIEVDASGTIVDTTNRDIVLSYKIEYEPETANAFGSDSEDNSTTPILPPKTPSPSRKFIKTRWRPRVFSPKKKNKKDKNNVVVKPAKTVCDSPGSATVGTEETQMTMRTYATVEFAQDHPVNPKKHPFFLRPRSTKA